MPVHNDEIAQQFETLADLLEIEDANEFRVRAYRNAARVVRAHSRSMSALLEEERDLSELPGIGEDLAGKIAEIAETGRLGLLEEVEERVPHELSRLMHVEGLGPKRVKALYQELKIQDVDDLRQAAKDGRIRELDGFGKRTEEKILHGLEDFTGEERRTALSVAAPIAQSLSEYLNEAEGVKQLTVAGSFRRRKETVGDLDIVITAKQGSPVMDRCVEYDEVSEVVSKGSTRSTVKLRSGLSVDLRVVPEVSYGSALMYFTGSKAHNIALRKIAVDRGWKINEYGMFEDDERIAGRTEEEIYDKLGLDYVEPELREDRGEVDAARKGTLPELVTEDDIRGDLHCHTKETDGHDDLKTMVEAARRRGYAYVSISDHSQHVSMAKGLDEKRLRKQMEKIDALNAQIDGIEVLKSIEVDILEDGSLDLPDSVLEELDVVVGAVHYKFDLSSKKQTERILRAMDDPNFNILAHPSGRLIGERGPYAVDMERLIEGAAERGCFLELNAQPDRLDLNDTQCRMAKEAGVKIAIDTDAHNADNLENLRYGIGQARRGWLEAADVLNALNLANLRRALSR